MSYSFIWFSHKYEHHRSSRDATLSYVQRSSLNLWSLSRPAFSGTKILLPRLIRCSIYLSIAHLDLPTLVALGHTIPSMIMLKAAGFIFTWVKHALMYFHWLVPLGERRFRSTRFFATQPVSGGNGIFLLLSLHRSWCGVRVNQASYSVWIYIRYTCLCIWPFLAIEDMAAYIASWNGGISPAYGH